MFTLSGSTHTRLKWNQDVALQELQEEFPHSLGKLIKKFEFIFHFSTSFIYETADKNQSDYCNVAFRNSRVTVTERNNDWNYTWHWTLRFERFCQQCVQLYLCTEGPTQIPLVFTVHLCNNRFEMFWHYCYVKEFYTIFFVVVIVGKTSQVTCNNRLL